MEDARVSIIGEAVKDFGRIQRNQVKAEIKELPSVLGETELPEKLVPCNLGFGLGVLVATNQRLVYLNKRPLSRTQIEHYRYEDITAIESKATKLIGGELRISVLGELRNFTNVPHKLTTGFAEHVRNKVNQENPLPDPHDTEPAPSPEPIESIYAAARKLGANYQARVKKELDELPAILGEFEVPEKLLPVNDGMATGLLVATNRRLLFIDKRGSSDARIKEFHYEEITSVEAGRALLTGGGIQLSVLGDVTLFSNAPKESTPAFADYVRMKAHPQIRPTYLEGAGSPPSLKPAEALSAAVRELRADDQATVKKELDALPTILRQDELPDKLLPCARGMGMGLLVATNQRLVFIDQRGSSDPRVEEFLYEYITSIESKKDLLRNGLLTLHVVGDVVDFASGPKDLTPAFAEYLQTKVPPENLLPEPDDTEPEPSPELAEAISKATRELGDYYRRIVKKELDELPSILGEGELPEKMMVGWYDGGQGLLVATGERLIFLDKRGFTGLRVGSLVSKKITWAQPKTGMITGSIRIHAAGNVEMISGIAKELAHPFAKFLRQKVSSAQSPVYVQAPSPPSVSSLADELKKLAELVDMGILTKEEFEQQKAKLLGS
ncbi:MAG: PH domain-containing protein [Chloroflexi bacterium]|nr:PH domain-containing protein [Chloroflexota bacterium]